jgi:hypothetical protein
MVKTKEEQTVQWAKERKNRQYNGQKKGRTDSAMGKRKEEQTIQWSKQKKNRQYLHCLFFFLFWPLHCLFFFCFDHCIVCSSFVLTIVLSVLPFFCPLHCLFFFCFGHCIWAKQKKNRQYNGQSKRRTDNAMGKTKEEQTIQWAKQKKNRQCNGQSKRRTDNTMAKAKEEQTMLYCLLFICFDHCIVRSSFVLTIVLSVLFLLWPLYCHTMGKTKEEQTMQWPKQKKNRQYNGQSKRGTDNAMAKAKEEQTIQ